jgi:hypothetical protein
MKKQLDIIKTDKNALMQFQLGMQKQMMSLPPDQRQVCPFWIDFLIH